MSRSRNDTAAHERRIATAKARNNYTAPGEFAPRGREKPVPPTALDGGVTAEEDVKYWDLPMVVPAYIDPPKERRRRGW